MAWSQLKTKRDYSSALKRLEALIDARRSDAQQNEFYPLPCSILVLNGVIPECLP